MGRGAVSGVMWLGRAVVFAVGLATILVILFVAVNAKLGAGGTSLPGSSNQIDPVTRLAGANQALAVDPLARRRQIEFPRGYARVNHNGPALVAGSSKGVIDITRTTANVYCFDLSFTPKAAVATAHINNNATVGTGLGNAVPSGCPTGFKDAAAITYAANDAASTPRADLSFGIVFK